MRARGRRCSHPGSSSRCSSRPPAPLPACSPGGGCSGLTVRDRRRWALAALQAAVTLSWMAYGYYQPRLLAHFGFETMAGILAWYLALAGTTLGPLAGDASDRLVRSGGGRFSIVRAG